MSEFYLNTIIWDTYIDSGDPHLDARQGGCGEGARGETRPPPWGRGSGDTHMSSRGTLPPLSSRPGVDTLRGNIAETRTCKQTFTFEPIDDYNYYFFIMLFPFLLGSFPSFPNRFLVITCLGPHKITKPVVSLWFGSNSFWENIGWPAWVNKPWGHHYNNCKIRWGAKSF